MNLVHRSESFNLKGNPTVIPSPATTRHREFSLVMEDKVKVINRTNNFLRLLISPGISTSKRSTLPTSNRIVQAIQREHQCGLTIQSRQFIPVVVLDVVNWGIMLTFAQPATCRLLRFRRIVVKRRVSNHRKYAMGISTLKAIRVNRTICVVE